MRIVATALLMALAACSPAATPEPAPTFTPDAAVPPPEALIYIDGTSLRRYDLSSRTSEVITDLPTADVAVAPNGQLFVVVEERDPRGPDPEGFRKPHLLIASTAAQEIPSELGPGRAPEWSPGSNAIAAIEPTATGETIVIQQLPGGRVETAAAKDELWSIVGWRADEVVAIGSRSGVVAIRGSTGEIRKLNAQPSQMWGVSPTEPRHVVVGGRAGFITGPGKPRPIAVNAALGDGSWSLDGATIGVVLIEGPQTGLALIDVATGAAREVGDGKRAQGNVVWALDGKTFAFVRVHPNERARLEAVVCTTSTECTPAFSWDEGVRLLGFR